MQTDEINGRATSFDPPFGVSRQQVDFYRDRRGVDIATLQAAGEYDALTAGLALRSERVKRLQQLAALMERDLFGGFLWLDQVKSIGSGPLQEKVDYEEFNASEVQQYRGVLDDIAKEMGDRQTKVDVAVEKELNAALDKLRGQLSADEYTRILTILAGKTSTKET